MSGRRDATVASLRYSHGVTQEARRPLAGAAVLRGDITDAIRAAVIEELAAVGYGRMSIEAVARRAGVAKTAVYRRWNSKLDMVLEMVSQIAAPGLSLPDSGSLVGDIELVLRFAARALRHRLASQIIPDLLAEAARNPQIAATLHEALLASQREVGARIVNAAIERGELPSGTEPDMVVDLIVGPLYWRLAISRAALADDQLRRMAAACAAAIRAC